jgi:hypothetical protein
MSVLKIKNMITGEWESVPFVNSESGSSNIPNLENYVKKTDFATQTVGGVVKMWTSADEEGNIGLNISTEV